MKTILDQEETPRYLRVYQYYRELILGEKLQEGTKLPSIRKGATQLQVSRTTMENAYLLLAAEGYIISKPQSGYYVTDIAQKQKKQICRIGKKEQREQPEILYDFVSSNVDRDSFRFELWRRYMKSALRQDGRLLSYGEPQGEPDFREVLSEYVQEQRGVICTPDQIVIGAGVQSLLQILCPLIQEKKKIGFYNPRFIQGRTIFEDHGYEIASGLEEEGIGVYYVSPSQMTAWGGVMSVRERLKLIGEAYDKKILLIEDDYNSEFHYVQKAASSIQGLAGGSGVVYLGTFSKMLLPSIRMSFMVLPPELLPIYQERKERYNQTASKAEQIALTQFIRDGHLSAQIRKSRKIHLTKAEKLVKTIRRIMGESVRTEIGDTGFQIYVFVKTKDSPEEIGKRAREKGVALMVIEAEKGKEVMLVLNCANVAAEDYDHAIDRIQKTLFSDLSKELQ